MPTASPVPSVDLNNGHRMPVIGLGTSEFYYQPGANAPVGRKGQQTLCQIGLLTEANVEKSRQAVEDAIDLGYRHIDTALWYQNEQEIGAAIRAKIADGTVGREDLFVTTKLWNSYKRPENVIRGLRRSLENLQLDYVDNFLIHTPFALVFIDDNTLLPKNPDGSLMVDNVDDVQTWKEMEKAADMGLTRSIGLSNYSMSQVQHILTSCRIKPANLQVEGHAYLMQAKLFEFCRLYGIVITAYAPLGSPARLVKAGQNEPVLLEEPVVRKIAKRHNKTPTQILIRYLIQNGRVPLPRSKQRDHLRENISVFDFELDSHDLHALDKLERNQRYFAQNVVE